jgi:hypothetical protein
MRAPPITDIQFEAAVFTTVDDARQAVYDLLRAGFTADHITVVCSDETKERYFREFEHQKPAGSIAPTAAIAGGTIGAVLGGLSVIASTPATGTLALWVAGPIAALAGAGAVFGSLVGAMMTRGVERELADYYQQAVVDGRILVAAEHSGPHHARRLAEAAQVLAEAGSQPLPLREGYNLPRLQSEIADRLARRMHSKTPTIDHRE